MTLHSIPVQNPQADHCRLQEVGTYCQESRRLDQWVPELVLQERWRLLHHVHGLKSWALWSEMLMQGRPGADLAGLSRLTSREQGLPFSETVRVETGVCLFCAKGTNRKIRLELHPGFVFMHWQKRVHASTRTWDARLLWSGQECCSKTAQHSSVFWRGRVLRVKACAHECVVCVCNAGVFI